MLSGSTVLQKDVLTSELVTQGLNQPVCGVDGPLVAKLQHGLGIAAGVFQRSRAIASSGWVS